MKASDALARWQPTIHHPDRVLNRPSYLLVRHPDGRLAVHLEERRGKIGPAHFFVENRLVYRTELHPDGPSSFPYLRVAGPSRRVVPAEGFPSGASDVAVFEVRPVRKANRNVAVARNPHRRRDLD